MELDSWIENVRKGEHLSEWDLKKLCDKVKDLLIEESNVQVRGLKGEGEREREFFDFLFLCVCV